MRDARDRSLTDHRSAPTRRKGLDYPFGERVPETGELMSVTDGVGWMRMPLGGPLGHINVWAVEEEGGVAIVDTGVPIEPIKAAWRAIFDGPLAGRTVTRVICTHLHPDHIGLAGWLCKKHQAKLWMTRGEYLTARLLVADARPEPPAEVLEMWRGAGWDDAQIEAATDNGWGNFARAVHRMPDGYVRVRDGDRLGAWRAVVGSGHSPEHMCLVDDERGLLISGDQVLPRISSIVAVTTLEPLADPLGEWLHSIAKLKRELAPDLTVLPAHGAVFQGLHARLDALADGHLTSLDRLETRLREAPRRAIDCFGVLFARVIDASLLGMATGETLAHLRHLEVAGRARREVRDGVWWWHPA